MTFALTYFLFLLLLTRPILLFVMTMSLQTPSIQYQNLPAEVASAIGSEKRQLRRLNVSSAGVLVRSFGESETGDGRGGGVYHAKVFKTKNIGGYSL